MMFLVAAIVFCGGVAAIVLWGYLSRERRDRSADTPFFAGSASNRSGDGMAIGSAGSGGGLGCSGASGDGGGCGGGGE